MIRLARRHTPTLAILLVFAAIPVAMNFRQSRLVENCWSPNHPIDLSGLDSATWPRETTAGHDGNPRHWVQGNFRLRDPHGPKLHFSILRSFDPAWFYTRPIRRRLGGMEPDGHESTWIESGSDRLPIQVMYRREQRDVWIVAYLFAYDGEPIASPLLAQLASAPSQLVNGTRPSMLIMVHGMVSRLDLAAVHEEALRWLADTWAYLRSSCPD